MSIIRPILPEETMIAKRLIYSVAHIIFKDTEPLEAIIPHLEAQGVLSDMDDIQHSYFDNGGTFLVLEAAGRIIGTGAIRYQSEGICEMKRIWLDLAYHGRGLGCRMVQTLFAIAREKGYRKVRLQTDPVYQTRALALYRRLGFYDIPMYCESDGDISLERDL